MLLLLLLLAACAPALVRVEAAPVTTLITNVRVIDSEGAFTGPHDVVLTGGRIADVAPLGSHWHLPVDRIIDGSGGTLLPGLVDTHIHLGSTPAVPGRNRLPSPKDNLDALLYAGVTTIIDLSMARPDLEKIQRRIDSGKLDGPRVIGAGKPFQAPGGHAIEGTTWDVETADDVDTAIAVQGQTAFIKLMLDSLPPGTPTLDQEPVQRLRLAADALGAKLIAHVGRPEDLERALDLPVDVLAHAPWSGPVTQDQARRMAELGIPCAPSLAVWESFWETASAAPKLGPLGAQVLKKHTIKDYDRARKGKAPVEGPMAEWAGLLATHSEDRFDSIATMSAAGVTILLGSDSPGIGIAAGGGTHREMAMLHAAGLSSSAVLVAATWSGSRLIDSGARFGAVRPGWEADLVLVDGNPVERFEDIHAIREVWIDGRRVERRPRR